jgi:unsaturated rhamnogalacturonyl hydrolase
MTVFRSLFILFKSFSFLLIASIVCSTSAQTSKTQTPAEKIVSDAGDTPKDAGPLATGLSPALTHKEIQRTMKIVADWQIKQSATKANQDWTYAPLYLGLLATSKTTGEAKYHDFVLSSSQSFQWKLWADRPFHADDEAIGQTYESLYEEHPSPRRIADTKATFDNLLKRPDDPNKDLWWWCDALFMAPAGLARMSAITGNHAYIDTMNHEWDLTHEHLYDPAEHLYSRDSSFLQKREANGKKLFWSRGNAWVLAGTVNVLRVLPRNDPSRQKYVNLFLEMSRRIASLQQPDGLWRAGLLDETAYPLPEISGSAFFTYAMTWGINEEILDRATYGPIVERAWSGMIKHIYADGRLGSIQPIGASPDTFSPQSSYVYGVGAFLLAGSELNRYAKN